MTTPYNPHNPGVNPYLPQAQAPRSAIPKVIGILMIIFGSIGLLSGLVGLASGSNDQFGDIPAFKTFERVSSVFNVVGLFLSGMQLFVGLKCLGYKSNAPSLAKVYGGLAMLVTLVNAVVMFGWLKPALSDMVGDELGGGVGALIGVVFMFTTILGLAWPTVIIALMSRPSAKAACVNTL